MSSMHTGPVDDATPTSGEVTAALEVLGSTLRLAVLREFESGPRRFDELVAATDASAHTLSRALSELRDAGLVDCHTAADRATVYDLTSKGESLTPVFAAIEDWADEWCEPAVSGSSDR